MPRQAKSDAASSSSTSPWDVPTPKGPLCFCGDTPVLMTSWTNANPGREFYKCVCCDFSRWVHPEEPHGWQKVALQKDQDQIWALKAEVDYYKASKAAADAKMKSVAGAGDIADICVGESYPFLETESPGFPTLVRQKSSFIVTLSFSAVVISIVAVICAMSK